MSVGVGAGCQFRAGWRSQCRLVDIVFDGTEIGGAQFGFVEGPRPFRPAIPLGGLEVMIAMSPRGTFGPEGALPRKYSPFGPASPLQLVTGWIKRKTNAEFTRVHRFTGIGIIARDGSGTGPGNQPGDVAAKIVVMIEYSQAKTGGCFFDFDSVYVAGGWVWKDGVRG